MKKIWRRGLPFSPEVAPLISRMPVVDEYRESLLRLQGVWDSLSMLGQMSGTLPDIAATRTAFQSLTEKLLDSLGRCLLTNVVQRMHNQGQVAIDILVRNLFERTADIGFLATDTAIGDFIQACVGLAEPDAVHRQRLESRFADYAAKYTVYDDIVVLAPDGQVMARLDRTVTASSCAEPWLADALTGAPYVERFGTSTLMDGRVALLYAAGIRINNQMQGVLCLSFRFTDEMQAIFRQLLAADDPAVILLIDGAGEVLASSDRWHIPLGAVLPGPRAATEDHDAQAHRHLRFAGREYLAVTAAATGYEGYQGPGWSAQVIVPIEQAFEQNDDDSASAPDAQAGGIDTRELFNDELQRIPQEARHIQRDLSRVLWNGKLQPPSAGASSAFTATLLREVGLTGERIRQVFDQATDNLHRSTLSAVFQQARHHARLAIDIMDRNLYERANDCRWWALDGVLRRTLAQPAEQRDAAAAAAVLRRINGLYTVYALLVLFDTEGRVVAVSDPSSSTAPGDLLEAPWVRDTLALRDSQSYAVSAHSPSALYADRATYVFAAAVRAPDREAQVVGGIAIVFDGEPQFEAMLNDSLPKGSEALASGSAASLLVTRSGTVVSSSDTRWPVGSRAPLPAGLPTLARGEAETAVIDIDGTAYVAGYSMAGGYREYHSAPDSAPDDVAALMLLRLGRYQAQAAPATAMIDAPVAARLPATPMLAIASFLSDGQWLGLPAAAALQALQRPRIAAIPNAPAHLVGMTMFEDRLLPVVDVAQLRNGPATTDVDAPVIVVQGRGGHRFALRVDELGPVFEVPQSNLQAVNHAMRSGAGERLVRCQQQMMILLDMDQLVLSAGVTKAAIDVAA